MPRVAKEKSKHEKPRPTKSKLKSKKAKVENTETNTKDDKFSFDEEIVIGLKRIDEPKVVNKKTKKG